MVLDSALVPLVRCKSKWNLTIEALEITEISL